MYKENGIRIATVKSLTDVHVVVVRDLQWL